MMVAKEFLYLTMHTSFRNLVDVTLQECKFNFLPKEFGTLHHLQEITLSSNYVVNTTRSAWEWLEQDSMRNNLKSLRIMHYDLPELPLQITCLNRLTKLNMRGSKISSLPKEFGNLILVELDLSYNNLGNSKESVWEWLMQTPIRYTLKRLNISRNYIKFLAKEFGTLSQLLELNLSNNLLGTCRHSTWEWLNMPIRNNLMHLEICGNFLTEFPLQITYLKELMWLDISNNKIHFLPKKLGTLPKLKCFLLSFNHLGKSDRNKWEWLEQAAVTNELLGLDLSFNLLTELPPQIGKLNALVYLSLASNEIKCLPQSLSNLKSLEGLNLSNNNLKYLPGSVSHLTARINVDENPFNLIDDDIDDDNDDDGDDDSGDDFITKLEVPSLVDCSAEVILKNGLEYTNYGLPEELIRYMNNTRHCFLCNNACYRYYEKRFINYPDYCGIPNFKLHASENIKNASFECYVCSSNCAEMLRN
ncbi:leucine-rich repeat-containing protein 58-like [Linepithema humile]|uniref:leucine-rich repeat-containing protein 58-like n=1 Tax=Linepithema humile TaxID=83485 RepID=UPI00351F37C5